MTPVSKLVFELSTAHNELKKDDTGEQQLGRSSSTAHEVSCSSIQLELDGSDSEVDQARPG